MIQNVSQRYESYGAPCGQPIKRQQSIGQALVSLVYYELGYGGFPLMISKTEIKVRTNILGRYDITSFSGSEGEIFYLLEAMNAFYKNDSEVGQRIFKAMAGNRGGLSAFVCTRVLPVIAGTITSKSILVAMLVKEDQLNEAKALYQVDASDLGVLFDLQREEGLDGYQAATQLGLV